MARDVKSRLGLSEDLRNRLGSVTAPTIDLRGKLSRRRGHSEGDERPNWDQPLDNLIVDTNRKRFEHIPELEEEDPHYAPRPEIIEDLREKLHTSHQPRKMDREVEFRGKRPHRRSRSREKRHSGGARRSSRSRSRGRHRSAEDRLYHEQPPFEHHQIGFPTGNFQDNPHRRSRSREKRRLDGARRSSRSRSRSRGRHRSAEDRHYHEQPPFEDHQIGFPTGNFQDNYGEGYVINPNFCTPGSMFESFNDAPQSGFYQDQGFQDLGSDFPTPVPKIAKFPEPLPDVPMLLPDPRLNYSSPYQEAEFFLEGLPVPSTKAKKDNKKSKAKKNFPKPAGPAGPARTNSVEPMILAGEDPFADQDIERIEVLAVTDDKKSSPERSHAVEKPKKKAPFKDFLANVDNKRIQEIRFENATKIAKEKAQKKKKKVASPVERPRRAYPPLSPPRRPRTSLSPRRRRQNLSPRPLQRRSRSPRRRSPKDVRSKVKSSRPIKVWEDHHAPRSPRRSMSFSLSPPGRFREIRPFSPPPRRPYSPGIGPFSPSMRRPLSPRFERPLSPRYHRRQPSPRFGRPLSPGMRRPFPSGMRRSPSPRFGRPLSPRLERPFERYPSPGFRRSPSPRPFNRPLSPGFDRPTSHGFERPISPWRRPLSPLRPTSPRNRPISPRLMRPLSPRNRSLSPRYRPSSPRQRPLSPIVYRPLSPPKRQLSPLMNRPGPQMNRPISPLPLRLSSPPERPRRASPLTLRFPSPSPQRKNAASPRPKRPISPWEKPLKRTPSPQAFRNLLKAAEKILEPLAAKAGQCPCCGSEHHRIQNCQPFIEMTVLKRWDTINKYVNVCSICLCTGHNFNNCNNEGSRCIIEGCKGQHHTLLHKESNMKVVVKREIVDLVSDDEDSDALRVKRFIVEQTTNNAKGACMLCESMDHTLKNCPDLFCYKCKQSGHFGKDCHEKNVEKCAYCKLSGHHINHCPIIKCRKCGGNGHSVMVCPKEDSGVPCLNCLQVGHHVSVCPKVECRNCRKMGHMSKGCPEPTTITCINCDIRGHHIRDCPFAGCRKCGAPGHWDRDCRNRPNQLKQSGQNEANKSTSNDYHHLGSEEPAQFFPRPGGSLLVHLRENLLAQGRALVLGDEMMHTWRLAGHNEDTLYELLRRQKPMNKTQLRLILVKELANASAGSITLSVQISELLDKTVDYYMPNDRMNLVERGKLTMTQTAPVQSQGYVPMPTRAPLSKGVVDSSLEKLSKLSAMIDLKVGPPDSDDRKSFESRVDNLEPLRVFMLEKMRNVAKEFSISESYVQKAASTIVKVLAGSNFSLYIMRRHLTSYGAASLAELVSGKVRLYEPHFPTGINCKYIVTFILDYLEEFRFAEQ